MAQSEQKPAKNLSQEVGELFEQIHNSRGGDPVEVWYSFLSRQPKKEEIRKVKVGKNKQGKDVYADYLAIENVQMKLDMLFPGWNVREVRFQAVFDEIVVSLTLQIYDPVLQRWIERDGIGASQIQRKSGSSTTDFMENKKPDALDPATKTAYSEAIKSAAKTIGQLFGRDLNRDEKPQYERMSEHIN